MFNSKCPSNLPVDDDKTKVLEDLDAFSIESHNLINFSCVDFLAVIVSNVCDINFFE